MEAAFGLFALAYSGLVLSVLAAALRRVLPPRRAALGAFGISAAVHLATTALMGGEEARVLLVFWGVPHLLVLPLLLWSARRQSP
jgi:hypothetical protein